MAAKALPPLAAATTDEAALLRNARRVIDMDASRTRVECRLEQVEYVLSRKSRDFATSTRRAPMHRGLGLGYLLCAATVVGFTLSGTNAFAQQPYGPNDA